MSVPLYDRPKAYYDSFERKPGDQQTTHYCPGCGHGNIHKFLAEAVDNLGIQDRFVLVSPVGCSVFAYYYMDVGNIQVAHGRAPAVGTAVKRANPDSIVVSYQGDGDLAAIGTAEIIHAANRGENMTVIFVNNAIYGMTGGQMAPTTLPGMRTTTSPLGRDVLDQGNPIRVCELLSGLEAPVYLERAALGDNRNNLRARKAVRKGLENQVAGLGFSLIEILSACPTGWKMQPIDACAWTLEEMTKYFPLGVYRDRTAEAKDNRHRRAPVKPEEIPSILGVEREPVALPGEVAEAAEAADLQVKASGFGGQGALTVGLVMAEAARLLGKQVSWLPSYGPEMRGGTAHCHVCISREPVGSPLITQPNVVFAMNLPSFERFQAEMSPDGVLIYNASMIDDEPTRKDIRWFGIPATDIASRIGNQRAANMVMLGAYLEMTRALSPRAVDAALPRFFGKPEILELNRRALEAGAAEVRKHDGQSPRTGA